MIVSVRVVKVSVCVVNDVFQLLPWPTKTLLILHCVVLYHVGMTMICCIISESVIFIRVISDTVQTSTYLISFKFWILWQICVNFLYTSLVNALMWSESKTTWRIQKSSGFFFKNMNCNVTVILIRKPKFTQ